MKSDSSLRLLQVPLLPAEDAQVHSVFSSALPLSGDCVHDNIRRGHLGALLFLVSLLSLAYVPPTEPAAVLSHGRLKEMAWLASAVQSQQRKQGLCLEILLLSWSMINLTGTS